MSALLLILLTVLAACTLGPYVTHRITRARRWAVDEAEADAFVAELRAWGAA